MTPDAIYKMFKLRVDVFVVEQQCAYPEIDEIDTSCKHLQIYDDQTLAAYCRLIDEGEKARIGRVIVNPIYRGQQLSRELLNTAIEELERSNSYTSIELSAQSHLTDFYGSFGFVAISEPYKEDGIPHVDMKKQLTIN